MSNEIGGTRKQVLVSGAVTISGQSVSVSGQPVQISGQHVFVESGVHVVVPDVSVSGSIVQISGQHIFVESGVHVVPESGQHVLISGQHVFVESGLHVVIPPITVSGLIVDISGQHVFVESGVYLASGIYTASGTYQASGVGVIINSGVGVTVQSGVYVASGIYQASGVGVIINSGVGVTIQSGVYLASGLKVGVSGEFIPVGGMDYIQSGDAVMHSGQYRMATTMKALESAVSGWEGFAEEARLFTGADAKHIRFHDIFDAIELDPVKWYLQGGTATVVGGLVDLYDAGAITRLYSRKQFLYGVLSLKVYADDWTEVVCGFFSSYTQDIPPGGPPGPNQSQVTFDADNFTVEAIGNGETNITISPALVDATFYDIDLVWTPSYAQLWVDGVLRHTVNAPSVPGNPAQIYFRTTTGHHLYVASVSLKPYGDIPLTVKGAVPIAGIDRSGQFVPISVDESGEIILASGAYVITATASGTYTASGVGVIINSGVGVTVQSGIILLSGVINATWLSGLYLASGQSLVSGQGVIVGTATLSGLRLISGQSVTIDPATLSGLRLISGQSVTVASGLQVIVQSGVILMSGFLNATWLSGLYLASGQSLISGQAVIVGITTLSGLILTSGLWIRSGTVVDIQGPTAVYAITSGNPMAITAASAGQMLVSKAVMSVTVKALSINSGDIYLGGEAAGDKPYSGCGFLLEPGEAINIDINEIGRVWACAEVSGDRVTYLGVQDA